MSDPLHLKELKALLDRLRHAVDDATHLDDSTANQLIHLDERVLQVISAGNPGAEIEHALESARQLEVQFAAEHPVAERIVREVISTLERIGV